MTDDVAGFTDRSRKLYEPLLKLHKEIQSWDEQGVFAIPVTEDVAPGYLDVIKKPMDLQTMEAKLHSGSYTTVGAYKRDFTLMCKNALTYNEDGSVISVYSEGLLQRGSDALKSLADATYAKPLTKAADPAIAKTERRAILTQQSLTTDVMLTRKLEDSAQGTVLGFFNSDNTVDPTAPRFGSILPPITSILPNSRQERSWCGVTPPTDRSREAFQSFAPRRDATKSSLTQRETDLLLETKHPADMMTDVVGSSTLQHMARICRIAERMNLTKSEYCQAVCRLAKAVPKNMTMPAPTPSTQPMDKRPKLSLEVTQDDWVKDDAAEALRRNKALMPRLRQAQIDRVASGQPWQVSKEESTLAVTIRHNLGVAVQAMQPSDCADLADIRQLLGVTLKSQAKQAALEDQSVSSPVVHAPAPNKPQPIPRADTPIAKSKGKVMTLQPNQDMGDNVRLVHDENISEITVLCDMCRGYGPKWLGWQFGFQRDLCYACGLWFGNFRTRRPVCFHPSAQPVMDLKDLPLSSLYRDDAVRDGRAETLEERQSLLHSHGNGNLTEASKDGLMQADTESPTSASVRHQRSQDEDGVREDDMP